MEERYQELKARLSDIHDLNKIGWVLGWDQKVMMPSGGSAVRAEQLATVNKIAFERFTSDETGKLLEKLLPYADSLPYDSDEASLIRVTHQDYEKALRVPTDLRVEMTRLSAQANSIWVEARKNSDFKHFLPVLEKQVELKHRYIECFDKAENDYDILLDDFEKGITTNQVKALFDELKLDLVPLISAIKDNSDSANEAVLHGHFPADKQREFCLNIIERFGFNPDSWRLDPTVHPFASNSCTTDIRITTRYYEHFIGASVFGSMHETGHGLYENGVSPTLERTPLCRGASSSLHESQSRMWENLVGRSRPFWNYFYPRLQAVFPEQYKSVTLDEFYRAINSVKPSLIRVEADEATYNLHIILRFELEQEMINDRLALKDLPEAWNTKMSDYLGIDVPDDTNGVLQDIHWSAGLFGYFPTYSLGNIISVQIWDKVLEAIPNLYDQIEQGNFNDLREWLRENLHKHGRKFTPMETLEKATGDSEIKVKPYSKYLKTKFSKIYNLR